MRLQRLLEHLKKLLLIRELLLMRLIFLGVNLTLFVLFGLRFKSLRVEKTELISEVGIELFLVQELKQVIELFHVVLQGCAGQQDFELGW